MVYPTCSVFWRYIIIEENRPNCFGIARETEYVWQSESRMFCFEIQGASGWFRGWNSGSIKLGQKNWCQEKVDVASNRPIRSSSRESTSGPRSSGSSVRNVRNELFRIGTQQHPSHHDMSCSHPKWRMPERWSCMNVRHSLYLVDCSNESIDFHIGMLTIKMLTLMCGFTWSWALLDSLFQPVPERLTLMPCWVRPKPLCTCHLQADRCLGLGGKYPCTCRLSK